MDSPRRCYPAQALPRCAACIAHCVNKVVNCSATPVPEFIVRIVLLRFMPSQGRSSPLLRTCRVGGVAGRHSLDARLDAAGRSVGYKTSAGGPTPGFCIAQTPAAAACALEKTGLQGKWQPPQPAGLSSPDGESLKRQLLQILQQQTNRQGVLQGAPCLAAVDGHRVGGLTAALEQLAAANVGIAPLLMEICEELQRAVLLATSCPAGLSAAGPPARLRAVPPVVSAPAIPSTAALRQQGETPATGLPAGLCVVAAHTLRVWCVARAFLRAQEGLPQLTACGCSRGMHMPAHALAALPQLEAPQTPLCRTIGRGCNHQWADLAAATAAVAAAAAGLACSLPWAPAGCQQQSCLRRWPGGW
jgi:hypothetical protein